MPTVDPSPAQPLPASAAESPSNAAQTPINAESDPASVVTDDVLANQSSEVSVRRPVFDDPPVGLWGRFIRWGEQKFSELSTKNNFWHRLCSWIFLPLAYQSGIKFRKGHHTSEEFECVVPFSRFNKNWYNAMAGAALLANSEVAGGMYIFQSCGSDYTVVCKHLEYRFRRPCVGPAIYRVEPLPGEDLNGKVATGDEFNMTVRLTILQAVVKKEEKERKVGESVATFHVTPKAKYRARKAKQSERQRGRNV